MTALASVQTGADLAAVTGHTILAAAGFVVVFLAFLVTILAVHAHRRRRRMVPTERYRDIHHCKVLDRQEQRTP